MKYKPCYLLVAVLCMAHHPFAQTQKILVDKIVARVGDEVILKSDINEDACISNTNGLSAKCALLESYLTQKVLAVQGAKDSLVSDKEAEMALNNRINVFLTQYGGPGELVTIANKSIQQIKDDLRQPVKQQELATRMREKILKDVTITPAEVKAYFDKAPALQVDETLEVSQLIIYPKPYKEVVDYITNQLLGWKHDVETGKQKFDNLAKLYSMDPGSRDQGGQYAVNRADHQWDPVWFGAIWKLKDGQISPIIKSGYGYHIIQMVSRAGDDAVIRHILLVPQVTKLEIDDAKAKLDSIRTQIVNGAISFKGAVYKYDEDRDNNSKGGELKNIEGETALTWDMLDKDMIVALKNLKQGDISNPLAYKDDMQRDAVRLIYLSKNTPAHTANLKDDYTLIAQRALDAKREKVVQQWLDTHIPSMYVSVDKNYADCSNLGKWSEYLQ